MSGLVLFIFYGSILFCIISCAVKLFIYARFPVHLRWETYKAGSVYENRNSWQKQGIGPVEKLGDIAGNVVTLRDYYKNNRLFWLALYPFHLGIYLLILWHVWLFVYPVVFRETWSVDYSLIWGHTATGLIFIGALGILFMRIFVRAFRTSYPRRHYFKWLIIILAAGTGYAAVEYYFNGVMANVLGYVKYQLEFDMASKLNPPLMPSLHAVTVSAVLIYLPFSHAVRLFFRYYHDWRWNYAPNVSKSSINRHTRDTLGYPVAWAAAHIPKGAAWKDIARNDL